MTDLSVVADGLAGARSGPAMWRVLGRSGVDAIRFSLINSFRRARPPKSNVRSGVADTCETLATCDDCRGRCTIGQSSIVVRGAALGGALLLLGSCIGGGFGNGLGRR